jgi:hypothetical protein
MGKRNSMTKIPLDNAIWTRLYGPYGIRDVPTMLKKLLNDWNDDLARELFWEELHHQDSLYPVTFAALPWVWEMVQHKQTLPREVLFFFSHVVCCAVEPIESCCGGNRQTEKFRGLSLRASDHAHSWISPELRLTENDMDNLKMLESWFDNSASKIAQTCLSAIGPDDRSEATELAKGSMALNGGENIAWAATMWSDGCTLEEIMTETNPSPEDARIAADYSKLVAEKNQKFSEFLQLIASNKTNTQMIT